MLNYVSLKEVVKMIPSVVLVFITLQLQKRRGFIQSRDGV